MAAQQLDCARERERERTKVSITSEIEVASCFVSASAFFEKRQWVKAAVLS